MEKTTSPCNRPRLSPTIPPDGTPPRRILSRKMGPSFSPAHTGVHGAQDHIATIINGIAMRAGR